MASKKFTVAAIASLLILVVALSLLWGAFRPLRTFCMYSGSMSPAIEVGDRVVAKRTISAPAIGDIVVFDDPTGEVEHLIKRVIAVEGQQVDVRDGFVYVDGERLAEPYAVGPTEPMAQALPLLVPRGEVWVMGDNRATSGDSRVYGPVPISSVTAEVIAVYYPPYHARTF